MIVQFNVDHPASGFTHGETNHDAAAIKRGGVDGYRVNFGIEREIQLVDADPVDLIRAQLRDKGIALRIGAPDRLIVRIDSDTRIVGHLDQGKTVVDSVAEIGGPANHGNPTRCGGPGREPLRCASGHIKAVAAIVALENAAELLSQPDIDGALVGGAALEPDSLLAIAAAAAS